MEIFIAGNIFENLHYKSKIIYKRWTATSEKTSTIICLCIIVICDIMLPKYILCFCNLNKWRKKGCNV